MNATPDPFLRDRDLRRSRRLRTGLVAAGVAGSLGVAAVVGYGAVSAGAGRSAATGQTNQNHQTTPNNQGAQTASSAGQVRFGDDVGERDGGGFSLLQQSGPAPQLQSGSGSSSATTTGS